MCIPCHWRRGCLVFVLVFGNQAHDVQKVVFAGFFAGSRGRCNRLALVEIKGRASEHCARKQSTAGHSRMRINEPHMSKPERRIEIVFRRDEGCGQNLTCTKLVVTTWSCILLRRDQAAVIQVERQVFLQRSERGLAPKSW